MAIIWLSHNIAKVSQLIKLNFQVRIFFSFQVRIFFSFQVRMFQNFWVRTYLWISSENLFSNPVWEPIFESQVRTYFWILSENLFWILSKNLFWIPSENVFLNSEWEPFLAQLFYYNISKSFSYLSPRCRYTFKYKVVF